MMPGMMMATDMAMQANEMAMDTAMATNEMAVDMTMGNAMAAN